MKAIVSIENLIQGDNAMEQTHQIGRDIPEPVKREVRQRCAFGCVMCGLPIFHYDHIEQFSVVNAHTADNIVLLCPNHHQDKTSGRLDPKYLRKRIDKPYNRSKSVTSSYDFSMSGDDGLFIFGSNTVEFNFSELENRFDAIRVEGLVLLGLEREDGDLLLNLDFSDSNGQNVITVRRGEMLVSTSVWDFRMEGRTLTIHEESHKISVMLNLLPNGIEIRRCHIIAPHTKIEVNKQGFHFSYQSDDINVEGSMLNQPDRKGVISGKSGIVFGEDGCGMVIGKA